MYMALFYHLDKRNIEFNFNSHSIVLVNGKLKVFPVIMYYGERSCFELVEKGRYTRLFYEKIYPEHRDVD